MSVQRIDRGELQKPTKMANGWLRVDGKLTRTGVFAYRLGDGKVRRELRLPEEVFHADTLKSFGLVPVTDEHPPVFLDASNTKEFARGAVSAGPRKDGKFVVGELLVTDAALIEKLEGGAARELSCGYNCDLEEKVGVSEDGEHYDAIQRNIRGNHVAVVQKGRAGPEARVRMDGAGIEVLDGDDDQPRHGQGQWSSTGGGGGGSKKALPSSQRLTSPEGRTSEHLKKGADRKLKIARDKEAHAMTLREKISAAERDFSANPEDQPRLLGKDSAGQEREMNIQEALFHVGVLEAQAGSFRKAAGEAQKELEHRARGGTQASAKKPGRG